MLTHLMIVSTVLGILVSVNTLRHQEFGRVPGQRAAIVGSAFPLATGAVRAARAVSPVHPVNRVATVAATQAARKPLLLPNRRTPVRNLFHRIRGR